MRSCHYTYKLEPYSFFNYLSQSLVLIFFFHFISMAAFGVFKFLLSVGNVNDSVACNKEIAS